MVKGLDNLSPEEQVSLFNILEQRLKKEVLNQQQQTTATNGEGFWRGLLEFRERIEKESIVFTDDDFADLRDKSLGREVDL